MYYYLNNNNLLICNKKLEHYKNLKNIKANIITEEQAKNINGRIFVLNEIDPLYSKRSFSVTNNNLLFIKKEDLNLLKKCSKNINIEPYINDAIKSKKVTSINTLYPSCCDVINGVFPKLSNNKKININIIGLGDVGGTLSIGLKLLGKNCINEIGIYDLDKNKAKRYEFELNQIVPPNKPYEYPNIRIIDEDNLFNCDVFIFCVSVGVPKVGSENSDVRLSQFNGNSKIIKNYALLARKLNFKGIFAVVSDPVDLLCKYVFECSNKDDNNNFDYKGLAPEQIRGYGLGVMYGRAFYYSKNYADEYTKEGRAFGPHGNGLIIINSIKNYDKIKSNYLTERAQNANISLRKIGFKPYIAPALSSGAISIISTIKSEWNYSANFLGGTFLGSRNKLTSSGLELETYNFNQEIFDKLQHTYNYLDKIYNNLVRR